MATRDLPILVQRWRDAEARWERAGADGDPSGELRRAVVDAWRAYNEAAGSFDEDEIVLVADDTTGYVAVFGPTERVLGWPPAELLGRRVADVTPAESLALMEASWSEFMARGMLEGTYELLARNGDRVQARFRARAHHPVPGCHTSRLRPIDAAGA